MKVFAQAVEMPNYALRGVESEALQSGSASFVPPYGCETSGTSWRAVACLRVADLANIL